jgi:hypothetical protein
MLTLLETTDAAGMLCMQILVLVYSRDEVAEPGRLQSASPFDWWMLHDGRQNWSMALIPGFAPSACCKFVSLGHQPGHDSRHFSCL